MAMPEQKKPLPKSIMDEYLRGKSYALIAREHGRSDTFVKLTLQNWGVELRTRSQQMKISHHKKFFDIEKAKNMLNAGATYKAIAKAVGFNSRDTAIRLRQFGLMRTPQQLKRDEISKIDVVGMYAQGKSVNAISLAYGLNPVAVKAVIANSAVKKRTAAEQITLYNSTRTRQQLASRAASARKTLNTVSGRNAADLKRAVSNQIARSPSHYEAAWQIEFAEAGVAMVTQFAVGRLNVDLAAPDARIAVEVNSAWHTTPSQIKRDLKRTEDLIRQGWGVHVVYGEIPIFSAIAGIVASIEERRLSPGPFVGYFRQHRHY